MKIKKLLVVLLVVICTAALTFGGCSVFSSPTANVTVENYTPTDEQWAEYLEKLSAEDVSGIQANVSKSLLSGVSVVVEHSYTKSSAVTSGFMQTEYYYAAHGFSLGSGVIVELDETADSAYIVTNCHVVMSDSAQDVFPESQNVRLLFYGQDTEGVNYNIVETQRSVTATTASGAMRQLTVSDLVFEDLGYSVTAEVVAACQSYDIALLKASASDILEKSPNAKAAEFAESDDVFIGQSVYTIGNPQWEGMSAGSGIVSKDSQIIYLSLSDDENSEDYNEYRVIRTDTAINGGNSGGALYNSDGKIIGIVNSKSVDGDIDNMGYAIPGSIVKRLWKLMTDGNYVVSAGVDAKGNITSGVKRAVFPVDLEISYTGNAISGGNVQTYEVITLASAYKGMPAGAAVTHVKICDADGNTVEDCDVTRLYHIEDALLSYRSGYSVSVTVNGETTVDITCSFEVYS